MRRRWLPFRVGLIAASGVFLAVGVAASWRAYHPISSVGILLPASRLGPGSRIRVDTVSSGRGPVAIRVELVQKGQRTTLVLDRVTSRRWAFWDFRAVRRSTYAVVSASALGRFRSGPAAVRATVLGAPAWLRQPPAVVEEVEAELEVGPDTPKGSPSTARDGPADAVGSPSTESMPHGR